MQASFSGRTIPNIPPERSAAQGNSPFHPAKQAHEFRSEEPVIPTREQSRPETNPRRASGSKLSMVPQSITAEHYRTTEGVESCQANTNHPSLNVPCQRSKPAKRSYCDCAPVWSMGTGTASWKLASFWAQPAPKPVHSNGPVGRNSRLEPVVIVNRWWPCGICWAAPEARIDLIMF
jgi:hypothetical protein